MAGAPPVLSVRMSAGERDLLERAAAQARTNLSEFARQRLVEAAELELLVHPQVSIPAADWDRFEAWASRPAEVVPALQTLAASRPAWES